MQAPPNLKADGEDMVHEYETGFLEDEILELNYQLFQLERKEKIIDCLTRQVEKRDAELQRERDVRAKLETELAAARQIDPTDKALTAT